MGKIRAFTNQRFRRGDRGASGVEYALVIGLVLTGSTASFEMMDERIEEHYEETAEDIGESDLQQFAPSTTAGPSTTTTAGPSTTTTAGPSTTTTAAPSTTTTAPPTTTTTAPQSLQQNASGASPSGNFSSDGNGGYGVSNSNGNNWDGPGQTSSKITFSFTVTVEAAYKIRGSVKAPNGSDDSFFVQVDGGPSDGYLWDVNNSSSYSNDYVADRYGADPVTLTLAPGEHTVTLWLRESGTYVQSLELVAV